MPLRSNTSKDAAFYVLVAVLAFVVVTFVGEALAYLSILAFVSSATVTHAKGDYHSSEFILTMCLYMALGRYL